MYTNVEYKLCLNRKSQITIQITVCVMPTFILFIGISEPNDIHYLQGNLCAYVYKTSVR